MTPLAKVCGLVRAEDAAFAVAEGADLLGFVSHPPSPRHCADLSVAVSHLDRAVLVQVADRAEAILALLQNLFHSLMFGDVRQHGAAHISTLETGGFETRPE